MGKTYELKTTWGGDPDFHEPLFGSGTYVTVNGEEYRVEQVLNPTKYIICKDGWLGPVEELILERSWGRWEVRERGWFE